MKLKVKYTNKTGTVGTIYFNLATYSENKMLEEGRKLKATMAYIGENSVRGITYDDKIAHRLTESNGEGYRVKKKSVITSDKKEGTVRRSKSI